MNIATTFEEAWDCINGDSIKSYSHVINALLSEINLRKNLLKELKNEFLNAEATNSYKSIDEEKKLYEEILYGIQELPFKTNPDEEETTVWKTARNHYKYRAIRQEIREMTQILEIIFEKTDIQNRNFIKIILDSVKTYDSNHFAYILSAKIYDVKSLSAKSKQWADQVLKNINSLPWTELYTLPPWNADKEKLMIVANAITNENNKTANINEI